MDELVFVENNRVVTDSFTVARVFGKQHGHVIRDIKNILSEVDGNWGISNFGETQYTHPQNGQAYQKYILTEDGFTLLVMGYTGHDAMQFKVRYIQEFNRMKERLAQLNTPSYMITNPIERAKKWIEEEESRQAMQFQLESQVPKVALYDVAMSADNVQTIGTVAKSLNVGPNKLFRFLREKKVLMSKPNNPPYQEYIDRGYFTVRQYTITHTTTGLENKTQTMVTPKGMAYIHKLLEESKQTS